MNLGLEIDGQFYFYAKKTYFMYGYPTYRQ
jgi:hypothetical protein